MTLCLLFCTFWSNFNFTQECKSLSTNPICFHGLKRDRKHFMQASLKWSLHKMNDLHSCVKCVSLPLLFLDHEHSYLSIASFWQKFSIYLDSLSEPPGGGIRFCSELGGIKFFKKFLILLHCSPLASISSKWEIFTDKPQPGTALKLNNLLYLRYPVIN